MTKFKSQLRNFAPTHFEYQLQIMTRRPTSEHARRKFAEAMNVAAELAELNLDDEDDWQN